ncbi:unnamed protein product [Adineta steineri]|uniref:Uncharacterized protein n=1 Tax=Adineta steineri TaxID=433720 RepID=A0A815PH60_9BILA|nr:unnamed protein product [Adineta steineri]CAF1448955.1 unnamed protein product [Adineta steineri]CAF4155129.1 unnamed protein product [Adineta steineri]CAF4212246.1 unnamed protein product [Adineta steineri]
MNFKLRKFIDEVRYLDVNYKDIHLEKICRFCDEQLFYIHNIPFRRIITNYLQFNINYSGETEAHSLLWHYTADYQLIKGWKTYSFRFPNLCDSDLYETFNVKGYPAFSKSTKRRHRSDDWYVYTGKNLLAYLGQYLHIQNVVYVDYLPMTKLFVNQVLKRMDIYFYFKSIDTKITITFEQGTPSRSRTH